jgi:hypothetical protein
VQKFKGDRPYLSRDLHLFLAVTNLRGVPYQITFRAGSGKIGHVMTMHGDRIHYCLEGFGTGDFTSEWLRKYSDAGIQVTPQKLRDDDEFRKQFLAAAIGTGAFPIGLPARLIARQTSDYVRAWPYRADKRMQLNNLLPMWPPRADRRPYDQVLYAGSDGGLIDNEPFELAHWSIMKRPGIPNHTSANKADRAVLMIDPFPTPSSFDPDLSDEELKEELWLRKVLFSLFPVLKDQARFKAIDLARAANVEVYSRFLIAPSRRIKRNGRDDDADEAYQPLATGVLEGFGGFLCGKFPEHDYQLGRRNCQQFLRKRLVLAANNPLFKNWPAKAQNPDFQIKEGRKTFRTIIPLLGSAKPEVGHPTWPRIGDDVIDRFMNHVKLRGNKLVANITREEMKERSWWERYAVYCGWLWYRSKILNWVRSRLVADLIRNDQLKSKRWLRDDVDRLIMAELVENPNVRTAEAIARGINRYCHGRVNWGFLTANDVSERLKGGKLAGRVIVSRERGEEAFQIGEPRRSLWTAIAEGWQLLSSRL